MIPGHFEYAVAPDLTADPLSYTWIDGDDLVQTHTAVVTRGRRTANSGQTDAGSMPLQLANTGDLTPYRAAGAHYPNMRRGRVVGRHWIETGASYLAVDGVAGSRASTPDAASWAITPDLAFAMQFRCPIRHFDAIQGTVIGQWELTGNQRAWLFYLFSGEGRLRISSNGTAESISQTSLSIPTPDAGPLTIAAEFDGDNGAGGNTTTWYVLKGTIDDLLADKTAYLFGEPDVNSGTLTIHNSTGTPGVGDVPGSGFSPYPGGIDAWYVRAGTLTSGTVVADTRNLPDQAPGTTSFVDEAATPKTWTLAGGAEITNRRTTITGHLAQSDGNFPGQSVTGSANRLWQIAGPLRRMRQGTPKLKSALYRRVHHPVNDVDVFDYYPLEDGRESTKAAAAIGGGPAGVLALSFAADDTLAASAPLPSVSGGQPYGWNLLLSGAATATAWEWTYLVNIPVAPDAGAGESLVLGRIDIGSGTTSSWGMRIDDTNYSLFARDLSDSLVLNSSNSVDTTMFGSWMIVQVSLDQSGADILWDVDLIPLNGTGIVFGTSGTLSTHTLGPPTRLRNLDSSAPQEGASWGHMMITSGATSGWLAPADTAYVGEPDGQRVFRLFREEGVPILVDGPYGTDWAEAIAAGAQPMGPQRYGLTLLDYLDEAAQVGNGLYGESSDLLGLTYRSGCTLYDQPAAMTFDTATAPTSPFRPSDSDRDYVNDATVQRVDGSTGSAVGTGLDDPDSDEVGRYDRSKTINPESDDILDDHASWWIHESTWPEERFDEIPLELAKDGGSQLEPWFDVNLGDRLVVEEAALPAVMAEGDLDQLIEGWTIRLRTESQAVSVVTRPTGPWNVGVLDEDTPTAGARRLASGDSTLNEDLTDVETGADVAFTSTRWITTADEPDHLPVDVAAAGEVMTATAITATTSPQTMTVTRSVNGVVKAQVTGETIDVAYPLRLTL